MAQLAEDVVRLAAVVGLVVEQVGQDQASRQMMRLAARIRILHVLVETGIAQPVHEGNDPRIHRVARGFQISERGKGQVRQDCVRLALPRQPAHPDPVRHQEVIERPC